MRTLRVVVVTAVALFVVALPATAQQSVLMNGADTTTLPDGGIIRKVQVDPQGRLVITGGGTVTDAGVNVTVPYCAVSRSSAVSVGTSAVTVPADGGLAGRWLVRVCNSPRNSGTPIVTCATGGATPDAGLLADGESLEVGDCAAYTTGGAVTCISDTAATAVSTWECR